MNILSIFKASNRLSQMMNKLLMVSLWSTVFVFFTISLVLLVGGWNWESIRIACMISGIGVVILVFTIFTKKSFEQPPSPKTLSEYYESALEVEESQGMEAAQKIYETICDSFDTNLGPAYLSLASIYLEKNKEEKALECIHQAAKENWIWYRSGLELLVEYYEKNQSEEKLKNQLKQLERVNKLEEEASHEIYFINPFDSLKPHDQSLYTFAPIIRVLFHYLELEELFIVEKTLTTIPDRKVYVFALVVDQKSQAQKYEEKIYHDCYEILAKPLGKYIFFEYTVLFLFLSRHDAKDLQLIQKIEQFEGARVSQNELKMLFSE